MKFKLLPLVFIPLLLLGVETTAQNREDFEKIDPVLLWKDLIGSDPDSAKNAYAKSVQIQTSNLSSATMPPAPLSRENCCLFYVAAICRDLSVSAIEKIEIRDKSGKLIGEGEYAGKYLVPHDGTIKIFWQYAPYAKVKTYNESFNVGMAYEIYVQIYQDKASICNPNWDNY